MPFLEEESLGCTGEAEAETRVRSQNENNNEAEQGDILGTGAYYDVWTSEGTDVDLAYRGVPSLLGEGERVTCFAYMLERICRGAELGLQRTRTASLQTTIQGQ